MNYAIEILSKHHDALEAVLKDWPGDNHIEEKEARQTEVKHLEEALTILCCEEANKKKNI